MARVELPPRATGRLKLLVRVSYYDLMRGYPELRDAAEVHYRLDATIDVSVIGSSIELPFSSEGTVPIFRPPVTIASKVRLADVSLEKARLIVDTEIENPNVFDLGIGELRYEVDLGDVRVAVHSSTADQTVVGPRQTAKVTLTGDITSAEGLVKLLMNGISGVPKLSASGPVRTPYGMERLPAGSSGL
jgi:LEA14-like dessication related protein